MVKWTTRVVVIVLLTGVVQAWAQSKVMTEDELGKFMKDQVKAYGAVMTPDNEIEIKKLFRTPEAYEGKVVSLGGRFRSPYGDQLLFGGGPGDLSKFLARGVDPKSKVLTYNDGFFLIGVWERNKLKQGAEQVGLLSSWVINTYLICGMLADNRAKKAEVLCETLIEQALRKARQADCAQHPKRLFEKSSIGGISAVHSGDERQSIPHRPH